jgi:cell division protein FtsB
MRLSTAIFLLLQLLVITGAVVTYREQRAELRQHRRELDQIRQRTHTLDERTYQLRGDWQITEQELSVVRDNLEDHLQIHHHVGR